ncbi:MAG TPA: hypothetical protein VFB63_31050 [Bryobacteraceae bacterium]|nr:hypothetical protein [Bryobacteraceae bacterium]
MEFDSKQVRDHAHALLDLLPPAKLNAVHSLLEVMIDEDDEELTDEERAAIQAGLDSLDKHGPIPMDDVLADFGLTTAEFEEMAATPDIPGSSNRSNG